MAENKVEVIAGGPGKTVETIAIVMVSESRKPKIVGDENYGRN